MFHEICNYLRFSSKHYIGNFPTTVESYSTIAKNHLKPALFFITINPYKINLKN